MIARKTSARRSRQPYETDSGELQIVIRVTPAMLSRVEAERARLSASRGRHVSRSQACVALLDAGIDRATTTQRED